MNDLTDWMNDVDMDAEWDLAIEWALFDIRYANAIGPEDFAEKILGFENYEKYQDFVGMARVESKLYLLLRAAKRLGYTVNNDVNAESGDFFIVFQRRDGNGTN